MTKPKLYLFIGYPGAGKTTLAKTIAENTGAVHLWADHERHKMFGQPTHSKEESLQLYRALNERAEALLASGQSVVFDTNFNFYEDRQKLREIATRHGIETIVIWIILPMKIAKDRSVHATSSRNGYTAGMSEQQFDAIVAKLEPPKKDEKTIKIDGTKLAGQMVQALLST